MSIYTSTWFRKLNINIIYILKNYELNIKIINKNINKNKILNILYNKKNVL